MNNLYSPANSMEPATVLTLRTVKAGFEEKFEAELHDFISRSLQTEGQLGVSVIRPVAGSGSREYGILRRFRDAVHRERFYQSPLFQEWEARVNSLTEGAPKHQSLSGLETWFVLPGQRAVIPPPRWKMAITTLLGVWPASMLVPWLLSSLIAGLPSYLRGILVSAGIVTLLTWVIMPFLARILRPWLYRG